MDLHSEKVPDIDYSPNIQDLFMFFGINWDTLGPVLWLLFGTLFAFFIIRIVKQNGAD